MNSDHALCAFLLWEEAARRKQLEMQVTALQQELERLKKVDDAPVPDA